MAWIIGKVFTVVSSYVERFKMQYILHCFAEHGSNCHLEGKSNITASKIHLGNNVFIGGRCTLLSTEAHIYIGNNVMFGPNVSIVTGNHRIDMIGELMINVHEKREEDDQDVIIEDDVWIGMGVTILKGVRIGRGSVIGANTLVTKNVPPYSVVTSKNEMIIKPRFTDEEISNHEILIYQKQEL